MIALALQNVSVGGEIAAQGLSVMGGANGHRSTAGDYDFGIQGASISFALDD